MVSLRICKNSRSASSNRADRMLMRRLRLVGIDFLYLILWSSSLHESWMMVRICNSNACWAYALCSESCACSLLKRRSMWMPL
ncbi:hypothetical protein D3C72_1809790 [compost metagenome]